MALSTRVGLQYVRFHGLLSDDMGTLVKVKTKLLYSLFNADQVFDFLLSIRMRPFAHAMLRLTRITICSGTSIDGG
jgi:xylan 1,4-beta-xylosidase